MVILMGNDNKKSANINKENVTTALPDVQLKRNYTATRNPAEPTPTNPKLITQVPSPIQPHLVPL